MADPSTNHTIGNEPMRSVNCRQARVLRREADERYQWTDPRPKAAQRHEKSAAGNSEQPPVHVLVLRTCGLCHTLLPDLEMIAEAARDRRFGDDGDPEPGMPALPKVPKRGHCRREL
jgi:hypothetical protein